MPGAPGTWGTERVLRRIWGLGWGFRGGCRMASASLSALPASLSAAREVAGAAAERDAGPYVYHPESKAEVPDAGTGYLGSADVGRTRQKDAS